jgi:hypothetical protein
MTMRWSVYPMERLVWNRPRLAVWRTAFLLRAVGKRIEREISSAAA